MLIKFTFLLLAYLPLAPVEPTADLVVMNHINELPFGYTQAVVIVDGEIAKVYTQPPHGRWFADYDTGRVHLITIKHYSGEWHNWRAKRYIEIRTTDNTWMRQYPYAEQ